MKRLNELYKVDSDVLIKGISINSNDINEGDIFVCIKGNKVDRHDYIDDAIKNGAVALVTAKEVNSSVPYVIVENPNEEVGRLAREIYDNPQDKLKLFAVTGTDGKTSVATITSQLIGNDKCGYIGTNGMSCAKIKEDTNNTTPSIEKLYKFFREFLDCGCENVCMEASSEAMLQGRLNDLRFDCIGITNITSEHLNSHKTLENYVKCKKDIMKLTKNDGICVINHDDNYYYEVKKACLGKILSYGMEDDNELQIVNYKLNNNKTEIDYKYQDKIYHVDSPLLGKFNVYNLACALLMCLSQGYEMEYLLRNVDKINVDGRLDIVDRGQGFMVMVDYAHTPNGIESLLDFVRTLDHNRIITVIGQAGERDTSKRKTVGSIVAKNSDIAIFCYEDPRGEDPKDIIDMMCEDIRDMDNYKIIIDRSEAIGYAIDIAQDGDMVLILGKGNETYQKMKDGEIYFNDEEEAIKYLDKKMNKVLI